ncbi:uncharacterized protein LOC128250785 isoform X1 [Octopus bimaculoides]|uniref:uncharacterized protein LOC128250785 isoform X1 n=1 Tax=Octopus bimaculoides TaxID=37653 RepID=UPI0022E8D779|nr:uncharacterized protein LOC128250785 isoform X1 [Octopus bimaculoides]
MWKYFIALLILSLFKIDDVANQDNLPKPGTKPDKGKPDDSKPDEGKPDKASNLNAADPSNPRHPPGPISTSIGSQQRVAECYSLVRKLDCKFYTCLSERLICPQTLLAKEKPNVYCKGPDEKVK